MKFIEQKKKLRIYNIDTPDTIQFRHGELFPNTIRSLVLGSSRCGKTNLIYFLLVDENGLRFEKPKYKLLKRIIDDIEGINIFTFFENEKVIPPEKVLPNSIFIMDDVLGENQQVIRKFFARGRHNKIDIFYLAQSYSKVPKQLIRDNANLIVLFKQDETNLKHVYNEHCSGDMTYTQFQHFCVTCCNRDRYTFVVICKDSDRDSGLNRFGFDTHVHLSIVILIKQIQILTTQKGTAVFLSAVSEFYIFIGKIKTQYIMLNLLYLRPGDNSMSFHTFPSHMPRKRQWEIALKMGKKTPRNVVVCSFHFQDTDFVLSQKKPSQLISRCLKGNVVPSINLPKRKHDKIINTPTKQKMHKRAERAKKRSTVGQDFLDNTSPTIDTEQISDIEELATELQDVNSVQILDKENIILHVDALYRPPGFRSTIMDLIRNDSDILTFTGVPTLVKFQKIVEVGELIVNRLHYNALFTLDIYHQILLTLIKLKLNISYKCVCVLFSISKSTCKNYFYNTIDLLYLIMKSIIIWPSKTTIEKNIPKCFINFLSTRVIVDGTETAVETPKCLACRIRTYSFYKGRHTIKFMV
ncbi:THAP-type domain-containing protein, partial [Aphis craccivora]